MEGKFWFLDARRGLYNEICIETYLQPLAIKIPSNANYIERLRLESDVQKPRTAG